MHFRRENSDEAQRVARMIADHLAKSNDPNELGHAEYRLSRESWEDLQRINGALLNLGASDPVPRQLRLDMLEDWGTVSAYRNQFQSAAGHRAPSILWLVLVSGFLLVIAPCSVYSPTAPTLVGLGLFAAFNGVVMNAIFAIVNPFAGPADSEWIRHSREVLAAMAMARQGG